MVALQNISLSLIYLQKYSEAIVYCDKVLEIKNSDVYALKNKIYALESLNQHKQVLELCTLILSTNSQDTWALNSMGLSLNELNQHNDALEYYEKSLRIDPNDVTALMNKAISLSHLGNYKDAINYYDMAQIIDSSLKEIPLAKSRLFEKLNMSDDAFLAAQGVLNKNMEKIKTDANKNKCSVFHQFCEDEFEKSNSK
jgi:tetratricopeptide (TPR) repeat protein